MDSNNSTTSTLQAEVKTLAQAMREYGLVINKTGEISDTRLADAIRHVRQPAEITYPDRNFRTYTVKIDAIGSTSVVSSTVDSIVRIPSAHDVAKADREMEEAFEEVFSN